MSRAQDLYADSIRDLPSSERLKLAVIILEELSRTAAGNLDYSDSWSNEDIQDLAALSMKHSASSFPEDTDLV